MSGPQNAPPRPDAAQNAPPIHALCAHPDAEFGGTLRRELVARGWRVEWVTDAAAAWDALERATHFGHAYDLCLLDARLPGGGPEELAERVHGLPGMASLPIAILTPGTAESSEEPRPDTPWRVCMAPFDALFKQLLRLVARAGERATSAPVLDLEAFEALVELGGSEDPGFVLGVVEQFGEDAAMLAGSIAAAIEAGDSVWLGRCAETLESTSANVGARRVAAAAARLRARSATSRCAGALRDVEQLRRDIAAARAELGKQLEARRAAV
ncbi:MAG: hypothetical protein MJE66_07070 [Proteobacteria bacterium]|nr:hypothetical protein [Pseudomonadota bacterium]